MYTPANAAAATRRRGKERDGRENAKNRADATKRSFRATLSGKRVVLRARERKKGRERGRDRQGSEEMGRGLWTAMARRVARLKIMILHLARRGARFLQHF